MTCARVQQVLDAWLDGELDAATAAELTRHVAGCPACSALQNARLALARSVRVAGIRYRAPEALRGRIGGALARARRDERARGPTWLQAGALAAGVAFACILGTYWSVRPHATDPAPEQLVATHVAALSDPTRLIAVASSERHVVKPWFQGKVDFAPAVKNLDAQGYVLLGARVDRVGDRPAAAVVYRIRAHVIELFVWRSEDEPTAISDLRTRGFSVSAWNQDGLRYAAISDVDPRDLNRFATLVRSP